MSNLRDTKDRINSVKKTQKITQAMKMVAASKFKRAQKELFYLSEYSRGLEMIFADVLNRVELDGIPYLFEAHEDAQKELIIVIAGDRGLCGGFNATVLKKALEHVKSSQKPLDIVTIGQKATQFFRSKGVNSVGSYSHTKMNHRAEVSKVCAEVFEGYRDGKYTKVTLFYNKFVSAITTHQIAKQLLPLSIQNQQSTGVSDFFYEPSKMGVLTRLSEEYINDIIFYAIKDSATTEEGSRMTAMDSASSNAKQVIQDLTLVFNRKRQAAITTELTEIVAGAASLN